MRIAVAGEALIDFTNVGPLTFQGHPGGSPFNAALAAARLGQSTGFITQLSSDLFGTTLREALENNHIDTRFVTTDTAPSTVAFVDKSGGVVRYAFLANGSADSRYAPDPLPTLPAELVFFHFGSIALLADPTAASITALVHQAYGHKVVVFDPNVRPSLIVDRPAYQAKIDHLLTVSHIVKVSDEDVAFLQPKRTLASVAEQWLDHGVRAVVITAGAQGATLYRTGNAPLSVNAPRIAVADTIGAGDTFTAGLSVGLLERGVTDPASLMTVTDTQWRETLAFAAAAAALNCTRSGCNPPTRDEVAEFQQNTRLA